MTSIEVLHTQRYSWEEKTEIFARIIELGELSKCFPRDSYSKRFWNGLSECRVHEFCSRSLSFLDAVYTTNHGVGENDHRPRTEQIENRLKLTSDI